jgi:hypothetical protein
MVLPILTALAASGPALAAASGAVGSAVAAVGNSSPKAKRTLYLIAGGLAFVSYRAARNFVEQAPDQDSLFGAASRVLGNEEEPGTIKNSGAATPYEKPGTTPTNVLSLTGRFLEPIEGQRVDRPLFADTYPVKVALENSGVDTVTGRIRVQVEEDGIFNNETSFYTPPVALRPGEARVFTIRVGDAGQNFTFSVDVKASLFFDDLYLATGNWERD